MIWLAMMLGVASAQDSVKVEVIHTVYAPKKPTLVLKPRIAATSLDVKLLCGSTEVTHSAPAAAGEPANIEIPVDLGQHSCTGSLAAQFEDGTQGNMPLQFLVAVQQAMQLRASAQDIDLEKRKMFVHVDRPVAQVELSVFGESGTRLGSAAVGKMKTSPIELNWSQTDEKVLRLSVKATTNKGLSATLDLFPWAYQIPHKDVIFPSGSSMIPLREVPKLRDVLANIRAITRRFNREKIGFEVPMALYLAGFTDTVGDRIQNQALSEERAKSLGAWFMGNGFRGPIHYQGFGENGLAVQTADGVSEPANRRAMFIIAADTPKETTLLPASNWKQLR